MTVIVIPIFETEFKPQQSLAKIMNERLAHAGKALQQQHLKSLYGRGFSTDDLVIYLSYNPKYKIRYCIVNDVPADIQYFVAELCGRLGYILWRRTLVAAQSISL